MSDCVVSGNTATGGIVALGGGIYSQGSVQLTRCTVMGNEANNGGGLASGLDASIEILDSVIAQNTASNPQSNNSDIGSGGSISHDGGPISIVNSTITDNSAGFQGGGISLGGSSQATISGSTIARNVGRLGGGVSVAEETEATIEDSTIENNEATQWRKHYQWQRCRGVRRRPRDW